MNHIKIHIDSFILLLLLQSALAILNWSLEGAKWHTLITVISQQSFFSSLKQMLKAQQFAFITPGRIGEPIAKSMFVEDGKKFQAGLLAYAGSILHTLVIITMGLFATQFIEHRLFDLAKINRDIMLQRTWLGAALIVLLSASLYLFSKTEFAIKLWQKFCALRKIIPPSKVCVAVLITSVRYLTYATQLWLIFQFFNIELVGSEIAWITYYYLLVTLSPIVPVADIGIKSSIAILLFSPFTDDSASIFCSILIIWLINTALPAWIATAIPLKRKEASLPMD